MSKPKLTIRGIALPVRLGCSEDERRNPQQVEIDVCIRFDPAPLGMTTDRLEDTVCYSSLVDAIKESVAGREFSLVEHLASEIFNRLRRAVDSRHRLEVTVLKVAPPIEEITKGAAFTVGD